MMQVFVLSVQNAVHARARSARRRRCTQFARQIGATIGVTVMGVIVNHGLPPGQRGRSGGLDPPAAAGGGSGSRRDPPAFFAAARRRAVVWVDRGASG